MCQFLPWREIRAWRDQSVKMGRATMKHKFRDGFIVRWLNSEAKRRRYVRCNDRNEVNIRNGCIKADPLFARNIGKSRKIHWMVKRSIKVGRYIGRYSFWNMSYFLKFFFFFNSLTIEKWYNIFEEVSWLFYLSNFESYSYL